MTVRYYGYPRTKGDQILGYAVKIQITGEGSVSDLPLRLDISKHAGAFAWGPVMVGARKSKALVPGAAQLALAICAHALANDGRALKLHQRFKFRTMANWPADHAWDMTAEEVAVVCDEIEAAEATPGQLAAVASEAAPADREPPGGKVSKTTSAGHMNSIPHARGEEEEGGDDV